MRPFKRRRRVGGWAVFIQEKLKLCGVRVANSDYREKLKDLGKLWKSLPQDQRDAFEARAAEQQSARESLGKERLSAGSESTELTLSQVIIVFNFSSLARCSDSTKNLS